MRQDCCYFNGRSGYSSARHYVGVTQYEQAEMGVYLARPTHGRPRRADNEARQVRITRLFNCTSERTWRSPRGRGIW